MGKVVFNLKKGFCIGNYRLIKRIGSGCTAEAYLVKEIPTEAERVLKLYESFEDNEEIYNLRDFEHYCWFLEKVSHVGLLPRYYHMGHTFLRDGDGIGNFYMVQEYIQGTEFSVKKCKKIKKIKDMMREFKDKVKKIHDASYALGDMTEENLLIVKNQIRMVDCDYGKHDKPNQDKKEDLDAIDELSKKAKHMTGNCLLKPRLKLEELLVLRNIYSNILGLRTCSAKRDIAHHF